MPYKPYLHGLLNNYVKYKKNIVLRLTVGLTTLGRFDQLAKKNKDVLKHLLEQN